MQPETVDVISAEQCGERGADSLHADAKAVRLVRIDFEVDLRHIEFEIAVGEEKQPAVARGRLDPGHDIHELTVIADGPDYELHWRPARRTRQRRPAEGQDLGSGDLGELRL